MGLERSFCCSDKSGSVLGSMGRVVNGKIGLERQLDRELIEQLRTLRIYALESKRAWPLDGDGPCFLTFSVTVSVGSKGNSGFDKALDRGLLSSL